LKNLVICPNCKQQGIVNVLGEVNPKGFLVMRFHQGLTRIVGEFTVICDKCEEPVYIRRRPIKPQIEIKTFNYHIKQKRIGTRGTIGTVDKAL